MTPYPLVENASFRFGDSAKVSLSTVVMSGKEPVVAVPPLSISLSPAAGIIRVGGAIVCSDRKCVEPTERGG